MAGVGRHCNGKIVSPKWKSFKGLRLLWRDKIRLNNGIWRDKIRLNTGLGEEEEPPLEGSEADAHRKPKLVLEGSYWKRRIELVIREYRKWRIYYRKRLQKNKMVFLSMLQKGQICRAELEKWSSQKCQEPEVMPEEAHMFDLDCFLSDTSDTLFTMTQKPCPGANDGHNTYTSNADMIQPGLTSLQPNLDDFMDIPDIFMSYRGQSLERLDQQAGYPDFESSSCGPFSSLSTPVVTAPQSNVYTQLAQVHHPLTSDMTFNPINNLKFKGHQQQDYYIEYHPPGMVSGVVPSYGHQPYPGAAISMATTNIQQQGDGTKGHRSINTLSFKDRNQSLTPDNRSTFNQRMCLVQHCSSSMHIGRSGSQLQPGSPWSSGIPQLTSIHCQTSTLGHTGFHTGFHTGTSHGSAVSAFLTQDSTHTNTPLLIPKKEKLSPVQIYGSEITSLTVSFSRHSGQTSPTNLLEREFNPESPPELSKMESNKTQSRGITHISAEKNRRFNIKLGFDTLHSLVTTMSSQPSIKISKAMTLQKTAEYISKIQQERAQLHEEAQRLRGQILLLNSAINVYQLQLPVTGVPITCQRLDHMREKFREYVRVQTLHNWNFWIFSIMVEPLFESYNRMVSAVSVEDLCRTTLSWLDQHCSLPALRPMVLSSLRLLSTSTSILTDPSLVPEQATHAVTQAQCLPHPTLPVPRTMPPPRGPSTPLPRGPLTPLPRGPSTPLPRGPSTPLPRGPSTPLPRGPSTPLPRGPSTPPPRGPSTGKTHSPFDPMEQFQ
uniref:Carbohydrate-responsive element-binding protein-like n=1 Tax=Salmo trutta TaxID=8032 RepID=A0A674AB95_SALTR